eukprot:scaffold128265_cov41-Prasinocladus_malaysianus.AAC.1
MRICNEERRNRIGNAKNQRNCNKFNLVSCVHGFSEATWSPNFAPLGHETIVDLEKILQLRSFGTW